MSVEDNIKRYLETEQLLERFWKEADYCLPNCISQKKSKYRLMIDGEWESTRGDVACCARDYFRLRGDVNPEADEILEERRIEIYGLPINTEEEVYGKKPCAYHTSRGCILKDHKPIRCLAWICDQKSKQLMFNYQIFYKEMMVENALREIILGKMHHRYFKTVTDEIKGNIQRIKYTKQLYRR